MKISVKCLNENTLTLNVKGTDTVKALKDQISKQLKYEPDQQRFNYRKQQLDDERTLSSYNIQQNSQVYLSLILQGGIKNDLSYGFDFNTLQTSNKVKRKFSLNAPEYRIVTKGLNFQAKCITQGCPAKGKKVWVKMGFGTFNVPKYISKCKCPLCKNKTETATNIGYCMTKIVIQGKRQQGQVVQWDETVHQQELTTFVAKDGQTGKWNYLEITTELLNDSKASLNTTQSNISN